MGHKPIWDYDNSCTSSKKKKKTLPDSYTFRGFTETRKLFNRTNLVPQFLDGQTEPEGISHLPRAYIKCQSLCWDSNFSAYTIQPVIKSVLCTSAGCRIPELCPSAWRRTSWCSDKTAADHTLLHRLEPVVHLIWFPHNSLQKPWVSTVIL